MYTLHVITLAAMLNEMEISDDDLNLIDHIPADAFQIQNIKTNTCLTASRLEDKSNTDTSSPSPELYNVSVTECNSSLPWQFWQWTGNGTLLNAGSYLCLTSVDKSDAEDEESDTELLVLMPCRESDNRQKWSCAGRYVEQATSGKCLTTRGKDKDSGSAEVDENSNEMSIESSTEASEFLSENSKTTTEASNFSNDISSRRKRDANLREMVEELGQFLYYTDQTTSRGDDSFDHSSQMGRSREGSHQAVHQPIVSVQYCTLQDELQMWTGLPKEDDDLPLSGLSTSGNVNTICSLNGTAEHNLSPCYTNDMNSISQVTTSNRYAHEWITCERHGYYVSGFYHTHLGNGQHTRDGLITGMQCCATSSVFTGEPESPIIDHSEDDCEEVEWWSFQDVLISEGWFVCPRGKFLKGFEIGSGFHLDGVHRIYRASCCRPHSAPDVYEHCYDDKGRRLDNTGIHTCRMQGYLVTAMYQEGCVEGDECTEKLTCCIEA